MELNPCRVVADCDGRRVVMTEGTDFDDCCEGVQVVRDQNPNEFWRYSGFSFQKRTRHGWKHHSAMKVMDGSMTNEQLVG